MIYISDNYTGFVKFLSICIELKEAGLMLHYTEEMQIINSMSRISSRNCGKGTSPWMWANCSKLEKPQGLKESLELWYPGIFTKLCLRLWLAPWKQIHVQNHLWFLFFCFSPESRNKSMKKNTPSTKLCLVFPSSLKDWKQEFSPAVY